MWSGRRLLFDWNSSATTLIGFLRCLFVALLLWCDAACANGGVFKKFLYKHSFRTPNLAQRDGSILFWTIAGDAIASSEQLRLAPSMRSRKGLAWNKRPMVESTNFEVNVALKISGQGRIGADGMAIWYTASQGAQGPVFGANDFWTGMGVLLDSFDNDGQKNNPFVSVMLNDGTRSYDHQTDGAAQVISGCQKDFRNKPFPVHLRIEYVNNVLTILMSDGMTAQPRYELCLRAENIFLPQNGFLGISAATGGLADDHDVLDFSVFAVFTEAQRLNQQQQQQIPQDERQKYDEEFAKQMQEYEEERKKFKEQHPDKVKDDEDDPSKYYEDATARELRLILESQTSIHRMLQQLETKLNEVTQQQSLHTTMLQQNTGAIQHQQQQQRQGADNTAPPTQQVGAPGAFQQHEKNEVLQSLRDLITALRDMKNYVNQIFTRSYNIEQKLGSGIATQASGGGSADAAVQQLRPHLDSLAHEVRQIRAAQQMGGGAGGPPPVCPIVSCTTSMYFTVIIAVQSAVILAFVYLRSKSDKAKFY